MSSMHTTPNGGPRYTNSLIQESSPYLLQHAHNPVKWRPWSEEAFAEARRRDCPVFLSIGYSTCHWCHVMEEESFEDETIAAFLNDHFVAIKVDREERPDIDSVYMAATQAMTGGGGWPMSVWLTPDQKPFYAGTYFPPYSGERGRRTGFMDVLKNLATAYQDRRDTILEQGDGLTEHIQSSLRASHRGYIPEEGFLVEAFKRYHEVYDAQNGGIGAAPKFPSSMPFAFLWRYDARYPQSPAADMATQTLHKMADGGLYDQIGGGFHRYSVDAHWGVPHFEKMLYDNALLTAAYTEAYQRTKETHFRTIAQETLDYVLREMTSASGTFYAATDADSVNDEQISVEGHYFTWRRHEIQSALNNDEFALAEALWDLPVSGHYEGRIVIAAQRSIEDAASLCDISLEEARNTLAAVKRKLFALRERRAKPFRDEKIITAWNALMISSLVKAGRVFARSDYTAAACTAMHALYEQLGSGDRLIRTPTHTPSYRFAFLNDYACAIAAALDLFEGTQDVQWFAQAKRWTNTLSEFFWDQDDGGYFSTPRDHESLLVREKPSHDGAEPSGNSLMVQNLLRLYRLTSDPQYMKAAQDSLEAFGGLLAQNPTAMSWMLSALDTYHAHAKLVMVITGARDDISAHTYARALAQQPGLDVSLIAASVDELVRLQEFFPPLAGKELIDGRTTVYVCENGVCRQPVFDTASMLGLVKDQFS